MTKADEQYYRRERNKESRRQWRKKFMANRIDASKQWHDANPGRLTAETLSLYQRYMRQADAKFKEEHP